MRVLLVEDDRELTDFVRRALEQEGGFVTVCLDGASGIQAAGRSAFDVMLPVMDGLDVTRRFQLGSVRIPIPLPAGRDAPRLEIDNVCLRH